VGLVHRPGPEAAGPLRLTRRDVPGELLVKARASGPPPGGGALQSRAPDITPPANISG